MNRRTDELVFRGVILLSLLAALIFGMAAAHADDFTVMKMPNDMGGHVYLTHEPCDMTTSLPIAETLYLAYSLWYEGTPEEQRQEACWCKPEIDLSTVPPGNGVIFEMVNIVTAEGRIFASYWKDFVPRDPPALAEKEY
jgi:hypothetical protein